MLRTAKQTGPTCLAYALYNAGVVDEVALKEYDERALSATLLEQFAGAMAGMIPPELRVGSAEFAKPWLDKYAPELFHPIYDGLVEAVQASNFIPTIPETGKGFAMIYLDGPTGGTHIVAYEDGFLIDSDSGDGDPKPETWLEYAARVLSTRNQLARLIKAIPHE